MEEKLEHEDDEDDFEKEVDGLDLDDPI